MMRLLLLLVFLSIPFVSITESAATSYAASQRLAPLVKARYTLFATVSRCGIADNRYAFDFVLDKFRGPDRETLRRAADDGLAAGNALASAGPCPMAIDRLKAADDRLLAQAEVLPNP